jgi:hypothetical protein
MPRRKLVLCPQPPNSGRHPPPAGVNDSADCARRLGELLAGRDAHVNLIPWNPVLAADGIEFAAPAPGAVDAFRAAVRGFGLSVTVRQEKGQDISGACGQLVVEAAAAAAAAAAGQGAAAARRQGGGGGGCGGGGGVRDIEELALPA